MNYPTRLEVFPQKLAVMDVTIAPPLRHVYSFANMQGFYGFNDFFFIFF
jgi:hypothetical protein